MTVISRSAARDSYRSLQDRYGDEGFMVVSLCLGSEATGIGRFVGKFDVRHPVAVLAPSTEERCNVSAYPTYMLVDRNGLVRSAGASIIPGVLRRTAHGRSGVTADEPGNYSLRVYFRRTNGLRRVGPTGNSHS